MDHYQLFKSIHILARLRLRPTSHEVAPDDHQKHYTSVIAEQAAGG